jgi:hypothetical protein
MDVSSKVWLGRFYFLFAGVTALAVAAAYHWISFRIALFTLVGAVVLGGGFKITEILVGILTKTRSANATGIVLILALKLGWWGLIFLLATKIDAKDAMGLAIGFAAFLIAILIQGLWAVGLPKISPPKKDS